MSVPELGSAFCSLYLDPDSNSDTDFLGLVSISGAALQG
jgi:hypothetical protein